MVTTSDGASIPTSSTSGGLTVETPSFGGVLVSAGQSLKAVLSSEAWYGDSTKTMGQSF